MIDSFGLVLTPQMCYEIASALFAKIVAFCGWLCGGECFGLNEEDVEYVAPDQGPAHGLRPGIGFFGIDLLKATKSSQEATADVIFASKTALGINGGLWWERLVACRTELGYHAGALFRHPNGSRWDSNYFWHQHLYPLLHLQWAEGDASLKLCTGEESNTIKSVYYNMHVYWRGGRSHSTRGHPSTFRKATPMEVTEHGRWQTTYQNMPTRYMSGRCRSESTSPFCVYSDVGDPKGEGGGSGWSSLVLCRHI